MKLTKEQVLEIAQQSKLLGARMPENYKESFNVDGTYFTTVPTEADILAFTQAIEDKILGTMLDSLKDTDSVRQSFYSKPDGLHTEEPWVVDDVNTNLIAKEVDGVYQYIAEIDPSTFSNSKMSEEEKEANAARIVECVNACAGMGIPEDDITQMQVEAAELRGYLSIALPLARQLQALTPVWWINIHTKEAIEDEQIDDMWKYTTHYPLFATPNLPKGWVPAPIEPNETMLSAGCAISCKEPCYADCKNNYVLKQQYKAMILVAQPEQTKGGK
jgi:hypothetical protein